MNTVANSRPRNVTIAVVILCVVLLCGLVSGSLHAAYATLPPTVSRSFANAILVLGVVFGVGINAFFVYNIFKGRNWARIVYLVFFLLGILFAVPSFIVLLGQSPAWVVFSLIGYGAQVVALVLLFTGPGNAWFKPQAA